MYIYTYACIVTGILMVLFYSIITRKKKKPMYVSSLEFLRCCEVLRQVLRSVAASVAQSRDVLFIGILMLLRRIA